MIFKIYDADFGIKYNDVNYNFEHVDSLTIEDNESVKLIRGANAKNKTGLVYMEGIKEPKKITVVLKGISAPMFELFKKIYEKRERCECYCVDRATGSSKIAKQAVLSQMPRQLTIDDTPDSMNVSVIFESFDIQEFHKDE